MKCHFLPAGGCIHTTESGYKGHSLMGQDAVSRGYIRTLACGSEVRVRLPQNPADLAGGSIRGGRLGLEW